MKSISGLYYDRDTKQISKERRKYLAVGIMENGLQVYVDITNCSTEEEIDEQSINGQQHLMTRLNGHNTFYEI